MDKSPKNIAKRQEQRVAEKENQGARRALKTLEVLGTIIGVKGRDPITMSQKARRNSL